MYKSILSNWFIQLTEATVDDGSCVLIGCSDPNYAEYHTQGFIPNNSDDPDVIQTFDALFCNELAVFTLVQMTMLIILILMLTLLLMNVKFGEVDDADY